MPAAVSQKLHLYRTAADVQQQMWFGENMFQYRQHTEKMSMASLKMLILTIPETVTDKVSIGF